MRRIFLVAAISTASLWSQATPVTGAGTWQALSFLEGTWAANTSGKTGEVVAAGTYTFKKELNGHILARHGRTADCKGPADFDCDHSDLLYIYEETAGQPLKAIYFDNEGHTIHYEVTTPTSSSVVFLSIASTPGPQYRLTYELKAGVMAGKFQMHMPGEREWKSYLEWNGTKR